MKRNRQGTHNKFTIPAALLIPVFTLCLFPLEGLADAPQEVKSENSLLAPGISPDKVSQPTPPSGNRSTDQTSEDFLIGGPLQEAGEPEIESSPREIEMAPITPLTDEEKIEVVSLLQGLEQSVMENAVLNTKSGEIVAAVYSENKLEQTASLVAVQEEFLDLRTAAETPKEKTEPKLLRDILKGAQGVYEKLHNKLQKVFPKIKTARTEQDLLLESAAILKELKKEDAVKSAFAVKSQITSEPSGQIHTLQSRESFWPGFQEVQRFAVLNAIVHPSQEVHPFLRFLMVRQFSASNLIRYYSGAMEKIRTSYHRPQSETSSPKMYKIIREESLSKLLAQQGFGALIAALNQTR